ncbi:MAG: hypothetical protein IIZ40_04660 [Bacilli bacterium]|nr:hypothetical protein [Bacilli bacterium]
MIDVNFEFERGILFVRLEGNINNKSVSSVNKNLTDIINRGGIKYLVFNINNALIEEEISLFDNCNKLIKNNGGKLFLCGLKNKIENVISSNYDGCISVNNELSALKMISVC